MKLKRTLNLVFVFLVLSLVVATNTFAQSVQSLDENHQTFNFADGNGAGIYFYLNYTDTRCGMNKKAVFTAASLRNVSNMEVEWKAYNLTGAQQFSGHKPLVNTRTLFDESKVGVLSRAYAEYLIKSGSQTWRPSGYIYHCGQALASPQLDGSIDKGALAKDAIESLKSSDILPQQYANINDYSLNEQKQIVIDTFKEHYSKVLNSYKLENGKELTADDLILKEVSTKSAATFHDKDINLTINNKVETDFNLIKVSAPEGISKDGKKYEIEGYIIVTKDPSQNRLDFGLIETEID